MGSESGKWNIPVFVNGGDTVSHFPSDLVGRTNHGIDWDFVSNRPLAFAGQSSGDPLTPPTKAPNLNFLGLACDLSVACQISVAYRGIGISSSLLDGSFVGSRSRAAHAVWAAPAVS